jgi:hypothetical protein
MPAPSRLLTLLSVLAITGIAGCGDDDDASPVTVATFAVAGAETFKVELATPELIDHARRLLAGEPIASIPIGTVVRDDPGVNGPWTWHIDPSTLEFADAAIEVCDGLPSYVENNTITSDQYCPWSAVVIAVNDA